MGRKGNLAVFEGSSVSETREAMPTKLVFMHFTLIPTCINFWADSDRLDSSLA